MPAVAEGQLTEINEINEWFASHSRLGFSVVLQEGLADEIYEPYSRNAEGQLLEGYRQAHRRLPPWNGIGGSRVGVGYARGNSVAWVDFANAVRTGWLSPAVRSGD
ncbi:MAG: Excinuclease subunit domain protein [Mycobacterium sp.]|nr:Excinuclease subunit domain protein [Mycobacterium sp.]